MCFILVKIHRNVYDYFVTQSLFFISAAPSCPELAEVEDGPNTFVFFARGTWGRGEYFVIPRL